MKRRFFACLTAFFLLSSLLSSAMAADDRTFIAMDTVMTLRIPNASESLIDDCEQAVYALEALFSVTRPDSEIARLNAGEAVTLSPDTQTLLSFALDMARETEGALDVTLYPVVRAWGFTTGDYRVPTDEELAALLENIGYNRIAVKDGLAALPESMMLDLGCIAKGYTSDILAEKLRSAGIDRAIMDLGGSICLIGSKSDGSLWRVGIADPRGENYAAVLSAADCSVVTSGCYERSFTADDGTVYGHIFDPSTGKPVDNGMTSVTVISSCGLLCDALSTALYVMGLDKACAYLKAHTDVEAVLISDDMIYATDGLKGALFLTGNYSFLQWIDR